MSEERWGPSLESAHDAAPDKGIEFLFGLPRYPKHWQAHAQWQDICGRNDHSCPGGLPSRAIQTLPRPNNFGRITNRIHALLA